MTRGSIPSTAAAVASDTLLRTVRLIYGVDMPRKDDRPVVSDKVVDRRMRAAVALKLAFHRCLSDQVPHVRTLGAEDSMYLMLHWMCDRYGSHVARKAIRDILKHDGDKRSRKAVANNGLSLERWESRACVSDRDGGEQD